MAANIEVKRLVKQRGNNFSLGTLDFSIQSNDTVAFLGLNGSGKSTLFELLSGNIDANEGVILVGGEKLLPDKFLLKRSIGYLPQKFSLPLWVTGKDVLLYGAYLHGFSSPLAVVQEALNQWDCHHFQNRPLGACSHGMRKRIALALANLNQPNYLILDEPFSGLDLVHMETLKNLILKRHKQSKLTIFSTHIISYVARLCSQVFIVRNGQLSLLSEFSKGEFADKMELVEKEICHG